MTLAWAAGAAQTAPEPEEREYPRYMVEVIIFEYAEGVSVGTERFLPEEPPPPGPDDGAAEGELARLSMNCPLSRTRPKLFCTPTKSST